MAEVFVAHDELLARDVAVKVFRTLPVTPDTASGAERQEIELHALARLNHPNLITLYDGAITNTDGPAFLVMELIDGPSLSARIADSPLTERDAREVGIQIADALAYVHAAGMVHRDVKPANILLGTDRTAGDNIVRARLSDFGIVRLLGSERLTSVDFTLGTASYLAPEQARGSDVGPVADVYSLGLVLIEALTGVRSFDGPAMDAVAARLVRDPEIPPQLPAPWPSLLAAMTSRHAGARPTAAEVAQTLRESSSGLIPVPIAGPAGVAVAAGALALGSPDADTVGLAAVGAGASAGRAQDDPWEPTDEPRRRRGIGLLVGATGFLAALAIGAVLLLRPASHPAPTGGDPITATNTTHAKAPAAHSSSVPTNGSAGQASTAVTRSRTPQPSSTAPSTTAAPRTSAAASTSTAPRSSTATSSAPASSSAAASSAAASSAAVASVTANTSPSP